MYIFDRPARALIFKNRRHGRIGTCRHRFGRGRVVLPSSLLRSRDGGRPPPGMRSSRVMETGRDLLVADVMAAAMGLQRQPLVAAAEVLGGGFNAVLPPVADTLTTPRSTLRRAGTPAQARTQAHASAITHTKSPYNRCSKIRYPVPKGSSTSCPSGL